MENLVGMKRKMLTVLEEYAEDGNKRLRCLCECGKEKVIGRAKFGTTQSCGCKVGIQLNPRKSKSRKRKLLGQRFEMLTIIEEDNEGRGKLRCLCDCGEETVISRHHWKEIQSCGCHRTEVGAARFRTHGMSDHPYHKIWKQMMSRCYRWRNRSYYLYGACGVRVDERWHYFPNFVEDIGERKPGESVHRIYGRGDYGPDNCEWADRKTQASNLRLPQETEADFLAHVTSGKLTQEEIGHCYQARDRYLKWYEGQLKKAGAKSAERKRFRDAARTHNRKKVDPRLNRWKNMMEKCYNPDHHKFHLYGGRVDGPPILVDPEWHDRDRYMAETGFAPPGKSLDRPDNNRNYGPNNWRWATFKEQAANRRSKYEKALPKRTEDRPTEHP